MNWILSWRADPVVARLADRHYSRQTHGSAQFSPPGRVFVLKTAEGDAGWVTSWPRHEHVRHGYRDSWVCTLFRNEGGVLSSDLITEAVAATRWRWDDPGMPMLTFIDTAAVRRKRDPGRCFRRAGFEPVGWTRERRLLVLALVPWRMPKAAEPLGAQAELAFA